MKWQFFDILCVLIFFEVSVQNLVKADSDSDKPQIAMLETTNVVQHDFNNKKFILPSSSEPTFIKQYRNRTSFINQTF